MSWWRQFDKSYTRKCMTRRVSTIAGQTHLHLKYLLEISSGQEQPFAIVVNKMK